MISVWSVEEVVQKILATRDQIPRQRSVLVAVSGIDASGKGRIAARIVAGLRARGIGVANINVDGWLNLPRKRFNPANPGEHFYLNAIRFDELFSQLVLPLSGSPLTAHRNGFCRRARDRVPQTNV